MQSHIRPGHTVFGNESRDQESAMTRTCVLNSQNRLRDISSHTFKKTARRSSWYSAGLQNQDAGSVLANFSIVAAQKWCILNDSLVMI